MRKRNVLALAALVAACGMTGLAYAKNPVLKIGFVGVTSGPAAAWGSPTSAPWKRVPNGSTRPAA